MKWQLLGIAWQVARFLPHYPLWPGYNGIMNNGQRLAHFPHFSVAYNAGWLFFHCLPVDVLMFCSFSALFLPLSWPIFYKLRRICDHPQVELLLLYLLFHETPTARFAYWQHMAVARMSNICRTFRSSCVQHMANTWQRLAHAKNKGNKTQFLTTFKLKYEQPLRGCNAPRRTGSGTHTHAHAHPRALLYENQEKNIKYIYTRICIWNEWKLRKANYCKFFIYVFLFSYACAFECVCVTLSIFQ